MIKKLYCTFVKVAEKLGAPLLMLWVRLWMATIFFKSGVAKLASWESTLFLFENEFKVPLLPVQFAAQSATFFELVCPVLIALGFMTRLAALPMLAMTLVIQFTYLDLVEHYYWMMVLGFLVCKGAGDLSVDAVLGRKYCK